MKKLCIFFGSLCFLALMSACSVYMAAKQPDQKNLHVLDQGTPRSHVIAELGQPIYTKNEEGKTCDVHSFVQGYSTGAKVGRAVFHGAADVLTFGIWEVAGTPIEAVADGTPVKVEVYYDETNCVTFIKPIQGADELKEIKVYQKTN